MRRSVVVLLLVLAIPLICQAAAPGFMQERMGTLSGRLITEEGVPVEGGGVVSFFDTRKGIPPMIADMHRIPDMVGAMRPDGSFSVRLLPGSYYLGALIITDPQRGPGPPRPGETFYFARDEQGSLREFALALKEEKDAGEIVGALPHTFPLAKNLVTIEGRLVKEDGTPYVGGVVLVKTDMNTAKPDFVSERTKADGVFKLQLPADTPYYLMGRERAVGRPVAGSYIGTYGSSSAISDGGSLPVGNQRPSVPAIGLSTKEGSAPGPGEGLPATIMGKADETVSGIDIMMFRLPVPEEQREKLQGTLNPGDVMNRKKNSAEQEIPGEKEK